MQTKSVAANIEEYFGGIQDPRTDRQKLHLLLNIIVIAICASICGADKWEEVKHFLVLM